MGKGPETGWYPTHHDWRCDSCSLSGVCAAEHSPAVFRRDVLDCFAFQTLNVTFYTCRVDLNRSMSSWRIRSTKWLGWFSAKIEIN